jgi:hypothetical protein
MNKTTSTWIEIIDISKNIWNFNISWAFTTTTWLKKEINEDRIFLRQIDNKIYACICDWHWWDEASNIVNNFFISGKEKFPQNKAESILISKKIEKLIFQQCWNNNLNWIHDITPETSFIAIEIDKKNINIISYWDCRGFILNNKKTRIKIKQINSWIWSFSYLGLRNRLAIEENTFFKQVKIRKNDTIILFSDWIDECIYETPTISINEIYKISLKEYYK